MNLYYDEHGIVRMATTKPVSSKIYHSVDVEVAENPLGKRVVFKQESSFRLAIICNWGDDCGIATYSGYLLEKLHPKVDEVKVFAEMNGHPQNSENFNVCFCWKRGQSMRGAIEQIAEWKPTVVLIQHEFGIFPRATHLLQMLQLLDFHHLPYFITIHSVYEHLDKVICTGAMKNIIVHTEPGRDCLRRLGHKMPIYVIPHGCIEYERVQENWNITHTPHAIIQFGFGFSYKGVDLAMEAVAKLKRSQPEKYKDIHYCYLCSESPHTKNINEEYYRGLIDKAGKLGLSDNVVIIRGFQDDNILDQYLRTYKLAMFPYVIDHKNIVYGASGAIRRAMSNRIPTIASNSHMFDDLEGVLPRPDSADALAKDIDNLLSNPLARALCQKRATAYVRENNWEVTANRYLNVLKNYQEPGGVIIV